MYAGHRRDLTSGRREPGTGPQRGWHASWTVKGSEWTAMVAVRQVCVEGGECVGGRVPVRRCEGNSQEVMPKEGSHGSWGPWEPDENLDFIVSL